MRLERKLPWDRYITFDQKSLLLTSFNFEWYKDKKSSTLIYYMLQLLTHVQIPVPV